ncbi:hypothetical protein O59_003385 [Cellvibrio sp. BR]|nr:hypothetical protein O59_003385 [Cellvibrio sp. BR]
MVVLAPADKKAKVRPNGSYPAVSRQKWALKVPHLRAPLNPCACLVGLAQKTGRKCPIL